MLPSKDSVNAAMRHVYTAVGAAAAVAVAFGLMGQGDADKVVALVNQIGGAAAVIVGAIAALLPIVNGARAAWTASRGQQIRKVEAIPGLKVVVDPIAAPQVAVDAANDPTRPNVVPTV